jgi:hypothetical protein
MAHIAISARNIVNDYCQNRGQQFLPPPVISKVCCMSHVMKDTIKTKHMTGLVDKAIAKLCCLSHVMKDTIKTKHMTGLVDKAIAKFNQNELRRYEKLFNTAYSVT